MFHNIASPSSKSFVGQSKIQTDINKTSSSSTTTTFPPSFSKFRSLVYQAESYWKREKNVLKHVFVDIPSSAKASFLEEEDSNENALGPISVLLTSSIPHRSLEAVINKFRAYG